MARDAESQIVALDQAEQETEATIQPIRLTINCRAVLLLQHSSAAATVRFSARVTSSLHHISSREGQLIIKRSFLSDPVPATDVGLQAEG